MTGMLFSSDPDPHAFDKAHTGLCRTCGEPEAKAWHLLPDVEANRPGKMRADHGDTARRAALQVAPKSGTQRARVLDVIRDGGERGATDEEVQRSLRVSGNTERPRRVELVEGGWIRDSGERRKTSDGKAAIVWVLTERAKAEL